MPIKNLKGTGHGGRLPPLVDLGFFSSALAPRPQAPPIGWPPLTVSAVSGALSKHNNDGAPGRARWSSAYTEWRHWRRACGQAGQRIVLVVPLPDLGFLLPLDIGLIGALLPGLLAALLSARPARQAPGSRPLHPGGRSPSPLPGRRCPAGAPHGHAAPWLAMALRRGPARVALHGSSAGIRP